MILQHVDLAYDTETGVFTRSTTGYELKGKTSSGYISFFLDGKPKLAHRVAMFLINGEWPIGVVDHIDGNKTNNCASNLRLASVSENSHNAKKPKGNTSGHKGVYWNKQNGKWLARVVRNYKLVWSSYFDDFELACLAVDEAREKYHGSFAKHV